MIIKDNQLRDRILQEIAKSFPFTFVDIKEVHDAISSFDDTIKTCEVAMELGINHPITIVRPSSLPEKIRDNQ